MGLTREEKIKFLESVRTDYYSKGKTDKKCPICNSDIDIQDFGYGSMIIKCKKENCIKSTYRGL